MLILSEELPQVIRYRSRQPVLTPELAHERQGIVANVVFPTAIDRRDDISLPDCFDIYYGMADNRIGVARLSLPERLPPGAPADPPPASIVPPTRGPRNSVRNPGKLGEAAHLYDDVS